MSKIFLQDSFKEFCEMNKFEINEQQVKIINTLEKFLDNNKIKSYFERTIESIFIGKIEKQR